MPTRVRPARAFFTGRTLKGDEQPDNRLVLTDQAFYAGHHAAGQQEVMQVAWIYKRDLDIEGLKRFHRNLPNGMLGRRIERSPLPFGRYRWVSDGQPSELDIAEQPRPREDLAAWLDERAQLPIDPESGPGWRLSAVSFTDGSSAATLVISHYVVDGIGAVVGVALASMGQPHELGYPQPRARTPLQAVIEDVSDFARDMPAVARAFVAATKEARRRRGDVARKPEPVSAGVLESDTDEPVTVPSLWIRLNMDEWNARAQQLGGTPSTLAVALTAKLDERMGRQHGDTGDVPVMLLVNDRTEGDVRAVAVSFARVSVDPTGVTTDLADARVAVKQALKTLRDTPDESSQLLPLAPFTPKRGWRQLVDYALSDPGRPAVCSNLGDTGPAVIRPDGTLCDAGWARGASQHMTRRWLERMGSQLHLYYGTAAEINMSTIHVRAYEPGSMTNKAELRELVTRTLAEFGLTGEID